jgi:ribosome recycling factor
MDRAEELIERVEAVFAPFEDRLPAQARDIAKQAHEQAKEARTQIRSMRPTTVA